MHVSLREIFGLLTFCSVVAWYGRQLNFDARFFSTSIPVFVCCGAFVILTRDTVWIVIAMFVPLLCLLGMFLSVTLVATVLLLTAAAMYRADHPRQTVRRRIVLAMCCAAVAMVVGGCITKVWV